MGTENVRTVVTGKTGKVIVDGADRRSPPYCGPYVHGSAPSGVSLHKRVPQVVTGFEGGREGEKGYSMAMTGSCPHQTYISEGSACGAGQPRH